MPSSIRRRNSTVYGAKRLGIWPWNYLVPYMQQDIRARRAARELRGQVNVTSNNPYDMEDFFMPMEDYIYDPVVRELIHNGATFQVAGLTNNSYVEEAHGVRHCVMKYQDLGQYVLDVAKKRLDGMLFVGLTDKHKESASMFANIVGPQVLSRSEASLSQPQVTEQSSLLRPITESIANHDLIVERLLELYESCAAHSKKSHGWLSPLKRISPAKFTKEARRLISEEIKQEIASLNSLDLELYHYAQKIFMKQQERFSKAETTPGSLAVTAFVSSSSYWMIFLSLSIIVLFFIAGFLFRLNMKPKVKL